MKSKIFANTGNPMPAVHRWLLAGVMLGVLALGWRYPLLGFLVPLSVLFGILGGAVRGRYVCGNLCPRGSFFDTFFASFGPRRPIPTQLNSLWIRGLVMADLLSLTVYRLTRDPGHLESWGRVFWQLFLITTLIALLFGIIFRPRAWCSICPLGTIGNNLGGHLISLKIAPSCRGCGTCSKACPMGHQIHSFREQGEMKNRDCLQCSACVNICPEAALSLQPAASPCLLTPLK